jgi:hypothetical protein
MALDERDASTESSRASGGYQSGSAGTNDDNII